jgi:hypothetical protein
MGLLVQDRIVVPGPIVNFVLAGAVNAAVVFTIPALVGQLVGAKSVKIHRVNLYNTAPAGNTQVWIGTGVGVGFAPLVPALDSFNGLNDSYGPETDLIEAESFLNVTAYVVALAGGAIDVQVEVIVVG